MRKHFKKSKKPENIWQIQEAKAKFFQVIENVNKKGYQIITKKDAPVAVIMSKQEFDIMMEPKISFLDFFKASPCPDVELDTQRSN